MGENKIFHIHDILVMMDVAKKITTYKNAAGKRITYLDKNFHSVAYGDSRTILDYVRKNAIITAYGCNPGNAIVILQLLHWAVAYSCIFSGFPRGEQGSNYTWSRMNIGEALLLIKKKKYWKSSAYIDGANYEERKYADEWETLYSGKVEMLYSANDKDSDLTAEMYVNRDKYASFMIKSINIKRLKSGKLRTEINSQYHLYKDIVEAMIFLNGIDGRKTKIKDLPGVDWGYKFIKMPEIPKDIKIELKAQLLMDKIKGS